MFTNYMLDLRALFPAFVILLHKITFAPILLPSKIIGLLKIYLTVVYWQQALHFLI